MIRITDDEFLKLASFIKMNFGINLFNKKSLLEGRLNIMLSSKGYTSFSDYIDWILMSESKSEIIELINKITTNYTYFMREEKHFQFLAEKVLPELENTISDKDLRIWSAGCSTGEEPYTLAMSIDEYFGSRKVFWNTKILATDISVKALDTAEKGIYSESTIKEIPNYWKSIYFNKLKDNKYEVKSKIKDEVIFRVFNLMDEIYPFKKKFHVIFCRNVMIYFDNETRKRLVNKFYDLLLPGGYLFIGHSETLNRHETKFKYIVPSIYQKEEADE